MQKPQGLVLPLATPLTADGGLDTGQMKRLVRRALDAGADALFANGSIGGFAFHTDATQAEIVAEVTGLAGGAVPVYAGVSDTSPARVLERIARLHGLPLAGVVALPPFFLRYGDADLERYFLCIAEASRFPVVMYENPKQVANSLTPALIEKLARHANIIGVKHSSDDEAVWSDLLSRDLPRERFGLVCGAELKMAQGLRAGFDGITGGFHNVMLDEAVALMRAARRGDWEAATAAQEEINAAYPRFVARGGFRGLNDAMRELGVGGVYTPSFLNSDS
jgi:4-hydroxy-tetrahydrodipicolinate synthase